MLLVDNFYCSIGSANWDVRSLRLNFEMNVEVIGLDLNNDLTKVFESKKIAASLCTSDQFTNRNLLVKLRDGIARMASPYL
jgi:cardiolipin synthase